MARPKSFLRNLSIDRAGRAHKCHHCTHRLQKGEKRLKVKVDRKIEHFCIKCAIKFMRMDIEKLNSLIAQISE